MLLNARTLIPTERDLAKLTTNDITVTYRTVVLQRWAKFLIQEPHAVIQN